TLDPLRDCAVNVEAAGGDGGFEVGDGGGDAFGEGAPCEYAEGFGDFGVVHAFREGHGDVIEGDFAFRGGDGGFDGVDDLRDGGGGAAEVEAGRAADIGAGGFDEGGGDVFRMLIEGAAAEVDVVGAVDRGGEHGFGGHGADALIAAGTVDEEGAQADGLQLIVLPVDLGHPFVGLFGDAVEGGGHHGRVVLDGAGGIELER